MQHFKKKLQLVLLKTMTTLLVVLEKDDEDVTEALEIDLQFLKTNFKSEVDGDLTIDDCIDFDQELCTNQSTISEKDIICKVLNDPVEENSGEEDDDDDASVVEMRKLSMEEVKSAIEMLEKFSLHSDLGEDTLKSIWQVNYFIEQQE